MAYRDDSYYLDRVIKQGDTAALTGLINKHKTMVFNIANRITRSREDAEEVAQDTFVRMYHALGQFKGDSKFTTWLYRIAYNLSLSKIRKKNLETYSVDEHDMYDIEGENAFDVTRHLNEKDRKTQINVALDALEELDQLLITLYYMDDRSVEEISEITEITQSNVKVRLFRARKKLHGVLEQNLKTELPTLL